jgi:hypothetical protein
VADRPHLVVGEQLQNLFLKRFLQRWGNTSWECCGGLSLSLLLFMNPFPRGVSSNMVSVMIPVTITMMAVDTLRSWKYSEEGSVGGTE